MSSCIFDVMKKEAKKTFTFTTYPSLKKKVEKMARKEKITFSEKVHSLLSKEVEYRESNGFINSLK